MGEILDELPTGPGHNKAALPPGVVNSKEITLLLRVAMNVFSKIIVSLDDLENKQARRTFTVCYSAGKQLSL